MREAPSEQRMRGSEVNPPIIVLDVGVELKLVLEPRTTATLHHNSKTRITTGHFIYLLQFKSTYRNTFYTRCYVTIFHGLTLLKHENAMCCMQCMQFQLITFWVIWGPWKRLVLIIILYIIEQCHDEPRDQRPNSMTKLKQCN